jgi:hypothetical protein
MFHYYITPTTVVSHCSYCKMFLQTYFWFGPSHTLAPLQFLKISELNKCLQNFLCLLEITRLTCPRSFADPSESSCILYSNSGPHGCLAKRAPHDDEHNLAAVNHSLSQTLIIVTTLSDDVIVWLVHQLLVQPQSILGSLQSLFSRFWNSGSETRNWKMKWHHTTWHDNKWYCRDEPCGDTTHVQLKDTCNKFKNLLLGAFQSTRTACF